MPKPYEQRSRRSLKPFLSLAGLVFLIFWVFINDTISAEICTNALSSPEISQELQQTVNKIVSENLKKSSNLKSSQVHLAVIDLQNPQKPLLAQYNGYEPVYPSSVIKMVYMGYVYHLAEKGNLQISPEVHKKLYQMIHPSSNRATAWIVDLWSGTCGSEKREPEAYREFEFKRNACNRWLRSLGIKCINACQKTWGSPIPPGEKQFLRGGEDCGPWVNRNFMTAVAAARFLQLLDENKLAGPESCDEMRKLMHRDVRKQPYQRMRIAGGAPEGSNVYSKTGTTSNTFHDAGIVVLPNGEKFILTVFLTGGYRGPFIRNVSRALSQYFMNQP